MTVDPPADDADTPRPKEAIMLLARMAEAVYWAGRYLERAEATARIVQVHAETHVDLPVGEDVGWQPLLAIVGVHSAFADRYLHGAAEGGAAARTVEEDVIGFLLHGEGNASSVLASLTAARDNLRTARPVVPREAWEIVNRTWLACTDHLAETATREGRVHWLRRVMAGCQQIQGVLCGAMSRDEALAFLVLGQNLERADLTTRVLDVRADALHVTAGDDPYDVVHWMAVLRSLSAYQPFRRAMPARPQGGSTLRFLLQDERFPRAVNACLAEARAQLKQLAHGQAALEACSQAALLVASASVPRMATSGLGAFLDDVQLALASVHDAVEATYFHAVDAPWPPTAP